ncbi:MAG: undecaprenyl-diphosphate phosphatase [Oscillospiraceae bacterium]|nr:undecaprenyl-diphosphate phosphatase [Oscillospiraceae bacterium]
MCYNSKTWVRKGVNALLLIELLKVIFLGIVEGVTEWLPVSSTGHMLLVDEFLHLEASEAFKEMFFVVIQLGAILAVVVLFWNQLWPFGKKPQGGIRLKTETVSLWCKVVVACIPGAIAALLLDDYIDAHLSTPTVIAAALILYGLGFLVVERWNRGRKPRVSRVEDISYLDAVGIGLFQVLSIIPGTSRSGATIIGALILGVARPAAAAFTFHLAVPVMFGLSFLKLLKFGLAFTGQELVILLVGCLVAFAVSLAVIRFLMNYIRKHGFELFGWYRIILGIIIIVYFLLKR